MSYEPQPKLSSPAILSIDGALRSSGVSVLEPGRRGTPTRLLSYARLTIPKNFIRYEAERELVRQVRAFQFPLERIHCAVLEDAEQAFARSTARSHSVLGLVRGVWMCHLDALGIPYHMVKARTWQEWCGLGGRTKRKDRLAALPGLARTATRTTDDFHHDVAAAILVGTYWLRNGGLGEQTT